MEHLTRGTKPQYVHPTGLEDREVSFSILQVCTSELLIEERIAMNPLRVSLTLSRLSSLNSPLVERREMVGALHLSMIVMPLRWV